MLVISPAKKKELQFRICNHGEQHVSLHTAREGEPFHRRETEVGRAIINSPGLFTGQVVGRREKVCQLGPALEEGH